MSRLIGILTGCLIDISISIIKIGNKQARCPYLPDERSHLTLPRAGGKSPQKQAKALMLLNS